MNKQELLKKLHDYDEIEQHLMKNPEMRINREIFHKYTETLNKEKASTYLFPLVEKIQDGKIESFPDNYFFKGDSSMKITICQHTRYSPAVTHKHDFYEMFFVYEGEFEQIIENEKITMRTGDICLIPPGVYHSIDVNNYSIVINILIQKDTMRELFMSDLKGDHLLTQFFLGNHFSNNINNYVIFHTNGDLDVTNMVVEMFLEVINQNKYYEQVLYSSLLLFFSHLLRYYEDSVYLSEKKTQHDILDFKLIKYINEHFKTVSLDLLANEFNYSKQYLSLRVKNVTGEPFAKYLMSIRMEIAKNMLCNTNMKISDIGFNIGFQSSEHFIRSFRKYFSSTPSKYRKDHK